MLIMHAPQASVVGGWCKPCGPALSGKASIDIMLKGCLVRCRSRLQLKPPSPP